MSILAYVIYYVCMSAMNLMCSSLFQAFFLIKDLFCSVLNMSSWGERERERRERERGQRERERERERERGLDKCFVI